MKRTIRQNRSMLAVLAPMVLIFVFVLFVGGALPAKAQDDVVRRIVEEGDIYRILTGNLLLVSSSFRGLHIIDLADVNNPQIIGRLQVTGTPVELYVVGDTGFVLTNNWTGYYGSRGYYGQVVCIDLDDPTNPIITDRANIPGRIQTSRLTTSGAVAALYVVTNRFGPWPTGDGGTLWGSRPVAMSFDISDGTLVKNSPLNLDGYAADIQMTAEVLLVGSNDWNSGDRQCRVSVVDITNPRGVMVLGDEVTVEGRINNQFNMDYYDGILRVVSGSRWGGTRTNHLQTFDGDIDNLVEVDHCEFGEGQSLFSTIFLEDRAFFQTALRANSFHAFSVGPDGQCEKKTESEIPVRNNFFTPVFEDSRLIGIGINKKEGRKVAASLFDTDLTTSGSLLAQSDVEYSWSDADWDHRAFSVLEGAVEVEGPDGVIETGLVLLPFTGWNADSPRRSSAVQIFTFSENTLTRRGTMQSEEPVRRSFVVNENIVFNLTKENFSLFDISEPDNPKIVGTCSEDSDCGCNGKLVACSEFTATECDRQLGCGWDTTALDCIPNDAHTFDECADLSLDQCNGRSDCYTMSCVEGVCQ